MTGAAAGLERRSDRSGRSLWADTLAVHFVVLGEADRSLDLCLDCAVVDGDYAAGLLDTGAAGDEGGSDDGFAIRVELNDLIHPAAGAPLENVVDLVRYHTDMRDVMRFLEVKNRYFTKDYPDWTANGVSALAMPGLLVEIKATAAL
jgi:hypothetical protein